MNQKEIVDKQKTIKTSVWLGFSTLLFIHSSPKPLEKTKDSISTLNRLPVQPLIDSTTPITGSMLGHNANAMNKSNKPKL